MVVPNWAVLQNEKATTCCTWPMVWLFLFKFEQHLVQSLTRLSKEPRAAELPEPNCANLTLEGACGNYVGYVNRKVESGEIENIEDMLAAVKARLKAFIVYQLGNTVIDHGIGCGYYDEEGTEDKMGIYHAMNEYLFGCCFNAENNENAYEYFLDFLLSIFRRRGTRDDISQWIPDIGELTRFLDKERLARYWRENQEAIRIHNFHVEDRRVVTVNYVANYKSDLESVYHVLDELIREQESVAEAA